MTGLFELIAPAIAIGVGATLVMDAWCRVRHHLWGPPFPDYALVGRWLGHMPRGRFRHESIARAPRIRGERLVGWVAHYLVGIGFAALLLALSGEQWMARPSPGPALAVGLGSVAAPFLLMQPGMGQGIAARRSPRPAAARINSLVTHGVFGVGLYLAGELVHWL